MASREKDEKTRELNLIFKLMGERGKEGELWKDYIEHCPGYLLKKVNEYLSQQFDNCMVLQLYGSAAEDLKSLAPNDVGDLDIVICPKSDDLMIHDEMIEYSAENPMHVKIKGVDHPVLRSCLLQGTEYVATSALKNFHSEIYGTSSPHLVDITTRILDIASREEMGKVVSQWQNNEACPALQVNYTHSDGPLSEVLETQKRSQTLTNFDTVEWEWLANAFCKLTGGDYSREHAEVLNEYLDFAREVQSSYFEKDLLCKPQTFPLLLQELVFSERAKQLAERVRNIEERRKNESRKNEGCFLETSENCQENESEGSKENESQGTLPFKDESLVTPPNFGGFQRSGGDLRSPPSRTSPVGVTLQDPACSSGDRMSKQPPEVKNGASDNSGHSKTEYEDPERESQSASDKRQQPPIGILPSLRLNKNPRNHDDFKSLSSTTDLIFEHIFKTATEKAKGTPELNDNRMLGGFDLVPAFRSPGWPKVALEWIKRERKWPSPDIVHKVVQDGFHLVVKPPKKGGNPECDFRISFSHAEYLLSQELNEVQRDCYRCLKKYHRAYLSKDPKGLVTFHLKNLFLQTIEETGAEMWIESNRAECVMKLLGNLLEALVTRDLRHFFVRSYNLFSVDYIENTEILGSLAEKAAHIIENPIQFAKLIEDEEAAKKAEKEKCAPNSNLAANTASGKSHGRMEVVSSKGSDEVQTKLEPSAVPTEKGTCTQEGSSSNTSHRYHDLKDIYLAICQELVDMAFNDDNTHQIRDPLETSLVKDLREITEKHNIQAAEFLRTFEVAWDVTYLKVS